MVTWGNTTFLGGSSSTATSAAPATSLFGSTTTTTTTNPVSATTTPTSTSTSGGGLFGSSFGSSTSTGTTTIPSTSTTTSSLFGTTTTTQQQQQQQQQQAQAQQWNSTAQQEALRLETALQKLHNAYSPTTTTTTTATTAGSFGVTSPATAVVPNGLCEFQAILYDPMTPEQQLLASQSHHPNKVVAMPRPEHVDVEGWSKALARNPDGSTLAPVSIVGADALQSRLVSQQSKATVLSTHVCSQLTDALCQLDQSSQQTQLAIHTANITQKQLHLQLLALMRKVELIRCRNIPLQSSEQTAIHQLHALSHQMDSLHRTLTELQQQTFSHRQQILSHQPTTTTTTTTHNNTSLLVSTDPSYRADLHHVLSQQRQGLEALHTIVDRNKRTVQIIQQDMKQQQQQQQQSNSSSPPITSNAIPAVPTYSY